MISGFRFSFFRCSEPVAALEEADLLQFALHRSLLLVGHVAERNPVLAQIQSDELHDPLAADDVAPVVADDVDDRLREVLFFARRLQVTALPGLDDPHQFATVVVRRTADAALRTALGQARQDRLILAVEHVVLAVAVQAALVVLVETLEGVLMPAKLSMRPSTAFSNSTIGR